jgi:RimJ/RimL family protein N-acetyltransferase
MNSVCRMKIHLRAFEKEDIDSIIKWVNDEAVTQYLSDILIYPISRADEVKWLESVSITNHREKVFAIETLNKELIGSVGLHNINWVERKAELGIMIGEREFWGKGYGSEAVREVLRITFEKMNLNRVYLRVFENNPRAIRVYEKCGFQIEGSLRQDHYYGRRYYDTLIMAMLKEEYFEKFKKQRSAENSIQGAESN